MPIAPLERTAYAIKVFLVDDQRLVGETVRRMLLDIPGLEYRFCADPAKALEEAVAFQPTVILQDLIMPGVDGIDMVRQFRARDETRATPLIVLSSKEEASTKAEAFTAGANDYLVKLPDKLEVVARIRYHSAAYISRLERDEAFAAIEAQQKLIAAELADATRYVQSLLPAPMPPGSDVPVDWSFLPSSSLGGDSFGYHFLSPARLALYLLDVCGHGVGAALLSVSAINTMRNRTLPGVDFASPSQVLEGLNRAYPMEQQNNRYFTIFYAVFDTATRELRYASGGHPAQVLITPAGQAELLAASGMMIGAFPFARYVEKCQTIEPGSRLFVFSDGCYEIFDSHQTMLDLEGFAALLATHAPAPDALDQVLAAARAFQGKPDFDDDFSLIRFSL